MVKRLVMQLGMVFFAQPFIFDISSFQRYDETFAFLLDDGCRYDAHIAGTLTPVYARGENGEYVEPNFVISANLVCPRMAPFHVEETLARTGPLTREHVEMMISSRASITIEDADHRCLHIPQIRFHGEAIVGEGIETKCTRISW